MLETTPKTLSICVFEHLRNYFFCWFFKNFMKKLQSLKHLHNEQAVINKSTTENRAAAHLTNKMDSHAENI